MCTFPSIPPQKFIHERTESKEQEDNSDWEKILANHVSEKKLTFGIYNEMLTMTTTKKAPNKPIQKWVKHLTRHFSPKMQSQWPVNTRKCKSIITY